MASMTIFMASSNFSSGNIAIWVVVANTSMAPPVAPNDFARSSTDLISGSTCFS